MSAHHTCAHRRPVIGQAREAAGEAGQLPTALVVEPRCEAFGLLHGAHRVTRPPAHGVAVGQHRPAPGGTKQVEGVPVRAASPRRARQAATPASPWLKHGSVVPGQDRPTAGDGVHDDGRDGAALDGPVGPRPKLVAYPVVRVLLGCGEDAAEQRGVVLAHRPVVRGADVVPVGVEHRVAFGLPRAVDQVVGPRAARAMCSA